MSPRFLQCGDLGYKSVGALLAERLSGGRGAALGGFSIIRSFPLGMDGLHRTHLVFLRLMIFTDQYVCHQVYTLSILLLNPSASSTYLRPLYVSLLPPLSLSHSACFSLVFVLRRHPLMLQENWVRPGCTAVLVRPPAPAQ